MKRSLYSELLEWKNSPYRKPLLLQGARQVGKTWLVKTFAEQEFSDFIYLNFEEQPELANFFEDSLDPAWILESISLFFGRKVEMGKTLLFLDEIQAAKRALTSLKYFCEKMPELHIIAAGSLLGVAVGRQSSFPVGKVQFMTLYPMSFSEYLEADGKELLAQKLRKTEPQSVLPFPDLIHQKLLRAYKIYLFTGGMPEVVKHYTETRDPVLVRQVQREILTAYERDFSKYTSSPQQALKTSEVWRSIPRQLARENKKFKFSEVQKKARAAMYEQSIYWLQNAGLIHLAYAISAPKIPLSAYAIYTQFKTYLFDTGLLGAMLELPSKMIVMPEKIFKEFNGAFIENFAAQELAAHGFERLYYWHSPRTAEVDFVFSTGSDVYPLEVKSGMSRRTKSLQEYAKKYRARYIIRASPRNFSRHENFINIPLYAISCLRNIK